MYPCTVGNAGRPILACFVACVLLTPSASAGEPPPPIRPASYDWHGPYAGVLLGLKSFRSSHVDLSGAPAGFSAKGRIAGIIAGYNFTYRDLVYGPEGDVSYGLLKTTRNGSGLKSDAYASLRARVGHRYRRSLPFLTAGISAIQFSHKDMIPGTKDSHTQFSATLGGGFEFALAPALTARMEYLYGHRLGGSDRGLDHTHSVRAAASYHFNR